MSTISTHLNWGASYIVNDWYARFVNPQADEARLVAVGRLSTAGLMLLAGLVSLLLSNALQAFQILLQIGAGTGLLFILRWFWWRINASSEIAAMVISFTVAAGFQFGEGVLFAEAPAASTQLLLGVVITTAGWLAVTFATPATDAAKLQSFYRLIRPAGPGWGPVAAATGDTAAGAPQSTNLGVALGCMVLGSLAVYSTLFATGNLLYGRTAAGLGLALVAAASTVTITRLWRRL